MRRLLASLLLAGSFCFAQDLGIAGITHVAFRVSDLAKSRDFYERVLGLAEPFDFTDNGKTTVAFLKINDRQYIELYPGLEPGAGTRFSHVCLEVVDMQKTWRGLKELGLDPNPMKKARAGNLLTAVKDPDGQMVEFLQYLPGSLHRNAIGKGLSPRRISRHLLHAGVMAKDPERSLEFYRGKLGFHEIWRGGPKDGVTSWINLQMPGPRGDYIELMLYSGQPSRAAIGSMQHVCLEVPDIQKAWKTLVSRGVPDDERHRPRLGRNGRWLLSLFDPDGSRIEIMEPGPAK